MYFERISAKLIFGWYIGLDLGDCYELKIALTTFKDDQNEEKNEKTKAKQLKNKKQHLKRIKNKNRTC